MIDQAKLIERLEVENDALRARISDLEKLAFGKASDAITTELAVMLTASERTVLGVLMQRERATKDHVMSALYRDLARDEAEPKIVDVFICKLRRKLKPYGIEIGTLWGQGYFLDAENKKKIKGSVEH
jgi:DNA-binding response OmpR family regulator